MFSPLGGFGSWEREGWGMRRGWILLLYMHVTAFVSWVIACVMAMAAVERSLGIAFGNREIDHLGVWDGIYTIVGLRVEVLGIGNWELDGVDGECRCRRLNGLSFRTSELLVLISRCSVHLVGRLLELRMGETGLFLLLLAPMILHFGRFVGWCWGCKWSEMETEVED